MPHDDRNLARALAARVKLFQGMYDEETSDPGEDHRGVRLLNPRGPAGAGVSSDATARRFAQLEIE